ncbi:MAG: DMT family transporter, partial [Phascolarctobacterium sp.]|nr:DMT family transporter [Phascolarctobacterium sp.]
VGKGGFITSLYIVIVPILGMLAFKTKVNILQWISVLIATVGMYFICINEAFTINKGDMYILICAFCFSIHILCIESVIQGLDGVRLSFIQFAVCTIANGILMFIFESPSLENLYLAWQPVFYAGIMSSGVAYTLQIVGQKYVSSVLASMLMSLESVFAMLSGWLLLNQVLTIREFWGCALVFAAIILAQLPPKMFGIKE